MPCSTNETAACSMYIDIKVIKIISYHSIPLVDIKICRLPDLDTIWVAKGTLWQAIPKKYTHPNRAFMIELMVK